MSAEADTMLQDVASSDAGTVQSGRTRQQKNNKGKSTSPQSGRRKRGRAARGRGRGKPPPEEACCDDGETEDEENAGGSCTDPMCWACGRKRSEEGVVWRRKDGYGDQCITCPKILTHGYLNCGKTRADMEKDVSTPRGRSKHLKKVKGLEDGSIKAKDLKEDTEIHLDEDDGLLLDEEFGNLWQVEKFKEWFPEEPPPQDHELTTIRKKGLGKL